MANPNKLSAGRSVGGKGARGRSTTERLQAYVRQLADADEAARYEAFHHLATARPELAAALEALASRFESDNREVRLSGIQQLVKLLPELQSPNTPFSGTTPKRQAGPLPPGSTPVPGKEALMESSPSAARLTTAADVAGGPPETAVQVPASAPAPAGSPVAAKGRAARGRSQAAAAPDPSRGYLIRIADTHDQERAVRAFFAVPVARCRLSDDRFLVVGAHLEALRREGIPFEDLTGARRKNG
jgi:hypothetical protein